MTAWPTLFGGAFFSIGAYLMCLETLNVMRGSAKRLRQDRQELADESYNDVSWRCWPFAVREVSSIAKMFSQESSEFTRIPYFASIAYFIGTCIYPVALVAAVFSDLSSLWTLLLSTLPYSIGGLLFAVGGFLECLENRVFTSRPSSLSWLVSVLNFAGGLLFTAGGLVLFVEGMDLASDIMFTIGSLIYTIGAVCSVVMWKDQQFGLAFLHVLNESGQARRSLAAQINSDGEETSTFSVRGVFFILLYCILSVLAVFNLCISLDEFTEKSNWFNTTRALNEFLPFLILHIVMLLHSAVVHTPRMGPFRALVMGLRLLAVVIGISSIASFWVGVWQPRRDIPRESFLLNSHLS